MRDLYSIGLEVFEYFGGLINLLFDILFFEIPILDVSLIYLIFGPGFLLYVGFVITKFFLNPF